MMWRSILLALLSLVGISSASDAQEPRAILVVVANAEMAEQVTAAMPKVRIAVLQSHIGETAVAINARAWEFRNADCLFFDPLNESIELAMFRERLQNHGVVPINLRQQIVTQYKRTETLFGSASSVARGNSKLHGP